MSTDIKLVEALRRIADIAETGNATGSNKAAVARIAREALAAHQAEQAGEAVAREPDVAQTAPKQIWLNLFDVDEDTDGKKLFPTDHEGITWAEDEVGDFDVPYIRADLVARPLEPLSDEQIDAAFAEHDKQFPFFSSRWSFEAGIEFANGITKDGGNG